MKQSLLSEEERQKWIERINKMSHVELANLYRFAPSGHPVFNDQNGIFEIFRDRFNEFGGMTPEVSKQIGW